MPVPFWRPRPTSASAAGIRVRFRMLDGRAHESAGEYLEVVPNERLVMSWQWTAGGEPEEAGNISRVEFHLRPIDIGTELTLTHAQLKNDVSRDSHARGWTGALDKLVHRFSLASAGDHEARG